MKTPAKLGSRGRSSSRRGLITEMVNVRMTKSEIAWLKRRARNSGDYGESLAEVIRRLLFGERAQ